MVAGERFELTTSSLWGKRTNHLFYPAMDAGLGFEPRSLGYEPKKEPLLQPAL